MTRSLRATIRRFRGGPILRRGTIAIASLALVCAGRVYAQSELTVNGRVSDENGVPVGGAQVKLHYVKALSAEALIVGTPTFLATTDDSGSFRVSHVPEGDYSLRVEKTGFFLVTGRELQITPDATEFTFTINHQQEVHEKVDVSVSPGRVDPAETAHSETLTTKQILDIPVPSSHDYQQSLIILPEVLRDHADLLHIAGARNTQSQYLLDGFEIGDPVSGQLDARFSVDAIRTAQIQTSRFGAEYWHPGAAILSFTTPEGDDRWRFGTSDFIPGINVQEGVQLGNYYPRFSISGPIRRGKLFFNESISMQHVLAVVKQQPSGKNETIQWSGDSLTRVLWRISANHSLHGSLLYNKSSEDYLGLDALHPQSATFDLGSHRVFGSLRDQLFLHRTLMEVGVGLDDGTVNIAPQGAAPYVLLVNGVRGNYFQRLHQTGRRYQFFANATSSRHWNGMHTLSAGVNVSSVELSQSAMRGEIQALRADQTLDRVTTFTGSASFHVSNALAGAFVQDSWNPSRYFIVQAGIRTDWDRFVHSAMAEPRVSLNFLPWGDNRGKFSFGWGMYNIPLNLSVIGQTQDQQQVDTLYDSSGAIPVAGPATSRFELPTRGLQQPYFGIAGVGWQQQIGTNTVAGIELLARDQHHGLVYETLAPEQIGGAFLLQTSRRDKYRSATVSVRHTFSSGALLFGSYTRSRASSDQVLDPTLGSLFFAPQESGPLLWDAPNRLLSWASIPTPIWGILFTYVWDFRSGFPYSAVNQQQFLIGAPNSLRFPTYVNLTIGLEKKFTFRKRIFAARLAVINILDRQNADAVVNNVDAGPQFGRFFGGQGRAITARLRFVGRK